MRRKDGVCRKLALGWGLGALLAGMIGATGCAGSGEYMEAWAFNDGGTGETVAAAFKGGTPGVQQWGVWLNSATFGKVLDFSAEGSHFVARNAKANFTKDFTISAFVLAPPREQEDRMILCQGEEESVRLYLKAEEDFALTLEMEGVTGLGSSGVGLADGKWHHILVSRAENTVAYWIDGQQVKTMEVEGSVSKPAANDIYIGADHKGKRGLDGSVAEVRLIKGAKSPAEATQTVIDPSDNEAKRPRLDLKKGVVIDRPQYAETLIPQSYTEKSDIQNCINMGFDHVKLQLVPEWMMDEEGNLIGENMEYITEVIQMVMDLDYRAILCVSPCASGVDYNFKTRYFGDLDAFERLVKWYGQLAEYIQRQGWSADHLAIQLMTEPYDNSSQVSWSWMSDRMWGAVRNVLPDHTIITSADKSGNLEHVKKMSPATDSNLIYSFTTYEPYAVGWSSGYTSQVGNETFWNYIGDIPYPIEEGVDYTAEIEKALESVPERFQFQARSALTDYVRGANDGGSAVWKNFYDSLYNREWHMLRAKSLDDWRQQYGGNIHIMVVEFGCYDTQYSTVRFGSAGSGITDEKRLEFIKDLRDSFEAYDIGWCYWSYNEGFTVFDTAYHTDYVGGSPSEAQAAVLADYKLLTYSLGLTPRMPETLPESLWNAAGAWSLVEEADGAYKAVMSAWPQAENQGISHIQDDRLGMAAFFDGGSFGIIDNPGFRLYNDFTLSAWVKTSGPGTILSYGDEFLRQSDGVYGKLMIQDFDSYHQIWGSNIRPDTDAPAQGTGSLLGVSEEGGGDIVFTWHLPRLNLSEYLKKDGSGAFHLSLYIGDPSKIRGGQLEFTSSQGPDDTKEFSWDLGKANLKRGWNDLVLKAEGLLNSTADPTELICARLYIHTSDKVAVKIDDIYAFFESPTSVAEGWSLEVDAGGVLNFQATGLEGLTGSGVRVADGAWHHVMVSYHNDQLIYYVDGQAEKSVAVSGKLRATSSADLVIGAGSDGGNGLTGSISHVAVYTAAKTPDQVWKE